MDDDDYWKHWRQQRADKILDVVLADEPALMDHEHEESQPDTLQAGRRHGLIYSIVFYAVCGVAAVAFIVCVLGMLR